MKTSFDIEADSWLTSTGIQTTVYIGLTDEPQFEKTEAFETLIDSALESYVGKNGKFARYHEEEIEELLTTLKNAYAYAEKQVQEIGFND